MDRISTVVALVVSTVTVLAGCSAGAADQTAAPTAATTPAVTASPTSAASAEASAAPDAVSLAMAVEAAVAQWPSLKAVTETEPGRVTVETSIVDPREDAGSAEALEAVAICEAAVSAGPTHVSVMEADGTHFVLYGHPAYPAGECSEV